MLRTRKAISHVTNSNTYLIHLSIIQTEETLLYLSSGKTAIVSLNNSFEAGGTLRYLYRCSGCTGYITIHFKNKCGYGHNYKSGSVNQLINRRP